MRAAPRFRQSAAWLAVAAVGFLGTSALALVALLGAVALWLAGSRPARRRDRAIVLPAALLAASGLLVAAFASWRQPLGDERFEELASASYAAFWRQLEERAGEAAARITERTTGAEAFDAVAAFAALAAETSDSESRPTDGYLLFDADGTVVAWGGAGLLHEPAAGDLSQARGLTASFGAATFFVGRPVPAAGRSWRIVAGRSVTTPALPFRLPGGVAATSWTTAPAEGRAARLVELRLPDAPSIWLERPGAPPPWIARARRLAALPWGLALLALATTRVVGWRTLAPTVLHASARPREATLLAGGAALALAIASGSRGAFAVAAALGTAAAAAAAMSSITPAAGRRPLALPERLWTPLLAVGAWVAIVLAAARWPVPPESAVEEAWLVFSFAALVTACLALSPPVAAGRSGWMLAAVLAALGAAASLATPWMAWFLGGVAAACAASSTTTLRPPAVRLAVASLVAALLAAVAWQSAAYRRGGPASATEVGSPAVLDVLRNATARELAAVDLETLGPGPPDRLDSEDLAFALWSLSPLTGPDLRSALIATLADGRVSTFSLGLPLAGNALDRSPAVWYDLVGEPSDTPLAEGSAILRAGGAEWGEVAFWALPAVAAVSATDVSFGEVTSPEGARLRLLRGTGLAASSPPTGSDDGRWSAGESLDRSGTQALAALAIAGALLGLATLFALPRPTVRDALRRSLRSYSKRLLLVVTMVALLPMLVINLALMQAFSARLEREQRAAGDQALQAAQRVLGEYVDTLAPGFGLDTVLDDDLLRWLARVVRRDVNLYWGSRLYATSQPELFSTALLPRRIPAEVHRRLTLGGEEFAMRTTRTAGVEYLELYAPFRRPSERGIPRPRRQDFLTLSLPLIAQQEDLERETAALRRRALLGTVALFLLLLAVAGRAARNFTRPLQELVAGTRRIAAGAASLELAPTESELQALVEAVDRMAAQIAASREQLRRGERLEAWAEMARLIAHEIKNPLTPIRLSAEHMREVYERQPERFGPVFTRCVDNILRQVEDLRAIAAEFSTYSGIPRIALEAVELDDVLREAVAAYDSGEGGRPVLYEPAGASPRVRLDPRLFVRALRNILENALRASGGEPVEVRSALDPAAGAVRIDVLDRGPGVADEMLERIFEPYFSTHAGGTGLGLPIARRILEEHGGRLWAEARSGGGLRVSMTVPLAEEPTSELP